jgi:hypothetical protein
MKSQLPDAKGAGAFFYAPTLSRLNALTLLLLAALAGCLGVPRSSTGPSSPAGILKAANGRLAHMQFEKLASFSSGRLYDYMDGAAEGYFKHNFQTLGTSDTKFRNTQAKAEVFLLAAPEDAKALFNELNDGKGKQLPAGLASASWVAKEIEGIFYRGPYLCRLMIYGNDKEARQLLDALAAAIDLSIPK